MKNSSKLAEKKIHRSEYVNRAWYEAQLARGWYLADMVGEYMIMRLMAENGYGETTAQQASLQKYGSIYELDRNQLRILLGKHWDENKLKDWNEQRQQPLREYKKWLKNRTD